MFARLLGFFSGFPSRHFSATIAAQLKKELNTRESLVFVSAWPSDYERNDEDATGMHGMFAECDMSFNKYCVIDDRTANQVAKQLIREASCIFLMGGNATKQFQLICARDILNEIRESTAVILGVSAGSSNMAKHALDIWESHVPYDGLGLADITIKAHITPENAELLQTLREISVEHSLPICAMEDESAIFVKDERVEYIGRIYLVDKGEVSPISAEFLTQRLRE